MKRFLFVAALAFFSVAIGYNLVESRDERAIRRRLHEVALICSKRTSQGLLGSMAIVGDLRPYFASNAMIRLGPPYPAELSPSEFASLVARAHLDMEAIKVDIEGLEFLPRESKGRIETLVASSVRIQYSGKEEVYPGDYRVLWLKENGDWKILAVSPDAAIRLPRPMDTTTMQ
ncbi:MAG: hypothetical protein NZ740_06330 [Kiritimatiellae bacterium]|nr:hypothetical protein [Kiritimatiellia bacterium]MDW8458712.1 hypothetical protein [Verrucomicrobiota bacterium]